MISPSTHPCPQWLSNAIFYEIYPQSFADSNGDGIGDIPGITAKLGYITDLGCNAIWLNPCFDSPFKDAGYDVRDYKKVAPRYGTNDDLAALFAAAHERGMHVILDLVPGHTSEEHEWFRHSAEVDRNEYSDRYIWTDSWISGGDGLPFIGGETQRPLHSELLQMPAGTQLRFRTSPARMAEARVRPGGDRHLRCDGRRDEILAFAWRGRLPR